jgi:hypothetical protein
MTAVIPVHLNWLSSNTNVGIYNLTRSNLESGFESGLSGTQRSHYCKCKHVFYQFHKLNNYTAWEQFLPLEFVQHEHAISPQSMSISIPEL